MEEAQALSALPCPLPGAQGTEGQEVSVLPSPSCVPPTWHRIPFASLGFKSPAPRGFPVSVGAGEHGGCRSAAVGNAGAPGACAVQPALFALVVLVSRGCALWESRGCSSPGPGCQLRAELWPALVLQCRAGAIQQVPREGFGWEPGTGAWALGG